MYSRFSFKQTPIGPIPKEWEVVRLGEIFAYIKGKKPAEMTEKQKEGYLPYLSTEYLRENKPTKFVKISKEIVVVNDGDLILLWDGSNAGEFFLGKKGVLSSTMVKFKVKEETDISTKFLFYSLKMKENYLQSQTKGTGIPHVDGNVLDNIKIPLPPLPEQRKIAEILSTVDEALQKVDEAIQRTERLKRGLMQELLTKGIGHKEFKDTEIGRIPKEWEVVRLREILRLLRNGLTARQTKEKTGYPVTRIETISDERIDLAKLGYLPNLNDREVEDYRLIDGDILFSHINSLEHIGKTAIYEGVPEVLIHGMNLLLLRPKKEKIDPKFLLFVLRLFRIRKIFANISKKAVNQASINQTELGRIKIPLPPLPEQRRIAEILSTVDKRLELERKRKEKLERIKRGLMNDLLTGKIRVKL
jgi:type I restriction enzyme S subunit